MQQANMQNPDAHQVKMMAELAGLDDQIGADDWTISKSEITGRKLIKRTPRYNVYKADWFGDVIVYEPIVRPAQYGPGRCRRPARRRGSTSSGSSSSSSGSTSSLLAETALDEADIRARLNLCLGLGETPPSSPRLGIMIDSESDADSAYSSYSSTPTRHTLKQQFEFPTQQSGIGAQAATAAAFVEQQEEQEMERHAEQSVGVVLDASRSLRKSSPTSPPVVLNRDSFPFGAPDSNRDDYSDTDNEHDEEEEEARLLAQGPHAIRRAESNYEHESVCSSNSSISTETESTIVNNTTTTTTISAGWFELNELRLVAHENFMLFMGASIEESAINMSEQLEQTASLVMQMSHPKSVSLYDLLHANNTTTTTSANYLSSTPSPVQQSPTKRFFTQLTSNQQHNFKRWQPPQQQQRRQLTIETKLNICQQVTDAMTYLHDKNIVHGRLTSANVYIEPNQRVKISLIDTDERQIAVATATTEVVADQPFEAGSLSNSEAATNTKSLENFSSGKQTCSAAANFNLSTLTYLSPELIRTIRLTGAGPRSGVQMDTSLLTKEADVFSFGTLLFELFEERFPFSDTTKSSGQPAPSSSAGPSAFRSSATELAASGGGCLPSPGTTKLFHSLCLDTPPLTPRFNYSFAMQQQQQQQHYHHSIGHAYKLHLQTSTLTGNEQQQQQQTAHTTKTFSNGNNIRTSASELIYQIGSGQIAHRNNIVKTGIQRCPALVEQSIARCWSCEPSMRPSFKQLRFE